MMTNRKGESSFQAENIGLRELLTQAGLDAARLLAQAGIDASENEAAKQLQRLLLEELHHRVKNTLATVIAITSQSLRNAESLEEGRIAVENRLFALGRAHDLLLEANWAKAQLGSVIHAAIEPFDDPRSSRFSLREINLDVDAVAVLPLTMSLNELCTNALKYGALSVPAGRIEITPSVDDKAKRFKLSWREMGGPIVREPKRRGFGTRLIDRLADQLHGEAQLKYDPNGIIYQLDLPLTALRKIAS
jgi:two-component sensor histidine kinase